MNSISKMVEAELTTNYQKYYRLVFSYTNNEADALDAVQEGAYKAIKKSSTIKNPDFISTWIYRIMINEAIRIHREKKRFTNIDCLEEESRNDSYTDFDLKKAVDTLEYTDQSIIKLRYFEDLSLKDIASVLRLKESTVKSRLYRALDKLKTKLEG